MKILLPADFSDEEQALLGYVEQLAQQAPVELTLLHVQQVPVVPAPHVTSMDYYYVMLQELQSASHEQLKRLQEQPGLQYCQAVHTELMSEPTEGIGPTIARYAEEQGMDLILACAKHRRGLSQYFMGTQLTEILRLSQVPVLAISPQHVPATIHRILFATDFSDASVHAFLTMRRTAKLLNARLLCVKINTPSDFYSERLFASSCQAFREACAAEGSPCDESTAEAAPVEGFRLYNERDLVTGILNAATDLAAGCVATATHGRRGFSLLMNGSVTEDLIRASQLPALVVHLPEEALEA
jgi:nucleotide-binding universal stress UspA family protein